MTHKAKAFLARAIRERRERHPGEEPAQSVAVGFAKTRRAGYRVPPARAGDPPKRDPPAVAWPWSTIWPPRWHFGDWMESYDRKYGAK